jgi:hypothetical protein
MIFSILENDVIFSLLNLLLGGGIFKLLDFFLKKNSAKVNDFQIILDNYRKSIAEKNQEIGNLKKEIKELENIIENGNSE